MQAMLLHTHNILEGSEACADLRSASNPYYLHHLDKDSRSRYDAPKA
jgi:hypothetical protein